MLTLWGSAPHRCCDGIRRRDFLRIGGLGFGGLTLADLLRLKAQGAVAPRAGNKAVIMVGLEGGPSHIDMYDLKPEAPAEFRGEFKPIPTNVPGIDICELMPLQAKIANKMTMLRGVETKDEHGSHELWTGFKRGSKRPAFGSVVKKLRQGNDDPMPPYANLCVSPDSDPGDPAYLGTAYRPFNPAGGLASLNLNVNLPRLQERKELLRALDTLSRDMDDAKRNLAGVDAFNRRALEMIASPRVREAFDLSCEPEKVKERYGKATNFLMARRLAEAGVAVVTLDCVGNVLPGGNWDTHGPNPGSGRTETNFQALRRKLPVYDQIIHTLVTDLYERGLDKDVVVVVWGEMGRTPRINGIGGRDHWGAASCVLVIGGGLRMGQVIGETDARAARSRNSTPYTPQNVLATLYDVLGIDAAQTLPDYSGRPVPLLDDPTKVKELE